MPVGTNSWVVVGDELEFAANAGMGIAVVEGAGVSTTAKTFAEVNVTGMAGGIPAILMRFNAKDRNLGPGADNFMGYECGLFGSPRDLHLRLGYHNHGYTDLAEASVGAVALPLTLRAQVTPSGRHVAFELFVNGKLFLKYATRL